MKHYIAMVLFALILVACEKNENKISDQKLYLKACQLIREGKLNDAKQTFLKLIQDFPESKFALEANSKLDEIYQKLETIKQETENRKTANEKSPQYKDQKNKERESEKVSNLENNKSKKNISTTMNQAQETKEKEINKNDIEKNIKENINPRSYRKITRMEEVTALIQYADALFEEKNGNKDYARVLLKKIISAYPLSFASSYAEVHLKLSKPLDFHPGASLRLYQNMLNILENTTDYTQKQEQLSKLSTQNIPDELRALHKALLEYSIDVNTFLNLLAEEKKDITKKNLANFANSHFVMRNVEWSKNVHSKIIAEKNEIYSNDNSSFHNQNYQDKFDFGLKANGGLLSLLNFDYSTENSSNSHRVDKSYSNFREKKITEHSQKEHFKTTISQNASPLKIETLSIDLRTKYNEKIKLMDQWKITYHRIGTILYKTPEVRTIYNLEKNMNTNFQRQKWSEAEENCKKLISLDAESTAYQISLMKIYYCQENYDKVFTMGKKLEKKSSLYQLPEIQGLAFLKTKNFDQAIHYLKIANTKKTTLSNTYALACVYSQKYELEKAYSYFQQAKKIGLVDYKQMEYDEDMNKAFFSYPKFAKLKRASQEKQQALGLKSDIEKLIKQENFQKAAGFFEKLKAIEISQKERMELAFQIYLPLAQKETKLFLDLIKKQDSSGTFHKEKALEYLNKIPKTETSKNLENLLVKDYNFEFFDDLKLYHLKYPSTWKIQKINSELVTFEGGEEIFGVNVVHDNQDLPYITKEGFKLYSEHIIPHIEKSLHGLKQVSLISSQKKLSSFRGFPSATYPFTAIDNNKSKMMGAVIIVAHGEYMYFIISATKSKQLKHGPNVYKSMEFLKRALKKELTIVKILANKAWQYGDVVQRGQEVSIDISGKWTLGRSNKWPYHGPEGTRVKAFGNHKILANSTLGSLIIRWKKNNQYQYREIRSRNHRFLAKETTVLEFRVNDRRKQDNSGHLQLTIKKYFPKSIGVVFTENSTRVSIVAPGSPAGQAGILPMHTIMEIRSKKINSPLDCLQAYKYIPPGSKVKVKVKNQFGRIEEKEVIVKLFSWK